MNNKSLKSSPELTENGWGGGGGQWGCLRAGTDLHSHNHFSAHESITVESRRAYIKATLEELLVFSPISFKQQETPERLQIFFMFGWGTKRKKKWSTTSLG